MAGIVIVLGVGEVGKPLFGSFPVCEKLATEILSLPMYAALSDEQIRATASALLEFAAVAPFAVEEAV